MRGGRGRRGWREGRGEKKGERAKRGKISAHDTCAAPRMEEGDKGWEGETKGREEVRPTPCPPLC